MISDWVNDEILTVCLDFNGLAGYIAVEPTKTLGDDLDIKLDWLPLTMSLNNFSPKQPSEVAEDALTEYKARRRHAREQYALRELERNCELLDLSIEQGSRTFDSTAAAIGLLWVRKCGVDPLDYVRAVFDYGYRQNQSIADISTINNLLASCEVSTVGFDAYCSGEADTELQFLQTVLLDAGVFEAPAYLYKGERFHGRAHLPLIRWYLSGEQGPPPV